VTATSVDALEIRKEAITSAAAACMISALNEELSALYPEAGANHFRLDTEEVVEGRGAFLVAYRRGKPVGCGAIRRLDERTAEIKRMYVDPETRGAGVGRAVLRALEAEAKRLGVARIVLETGERQLRALALYASSGFVQIPAWGEYVGSPVSVCMEKRLHGTAA
jgi:GNAT superfamily N-acetyltransferase